MAILSYLAISVVALLILNAVKERMFRPSNLPPVYTEFPYVPWIGSIWQFATGPREFLQRAHAKCGDIFTINLFGWPMTFLMSSEGHAQFFSAKEEVYDIREAYKCTVVTFGPDVCYDCPVKKMGEQLGFFKTGLTQDKFINYVPVIQDEVAAYFDEQWGDAGELQGLLGPEIRAQWSGNFAKMYMDLDHSFIPITFFFPNMPNPSRSKCVTARTEFEKIFSKVVEDRRNNPDNDYDDFLQVLMDAEYKSGKRLTIKEITGIMVGTLLGGQHTSNVTGTWALCHLFMDSTWWETLMREQKQISGDLSQPMGYDDVANMTEFDKVLNEVLRLHPPFFQLARVTKQSTQYNGYNIPAGRFVAVSPGAAQRLPSFWGNDAEEFDPNRWTPEKVEKHLSYSWIPFGGGRHQCSGRKFAMTSLKTVLSWMMRNYKMEYVVGKIPKDDYTTMVVAPTGPVTVKYARIKHGK